MGICPTSSKVRVTIFFGDGTTKNIETPGNITITVNNSPSSQNKKCWRWWGIGGGNDFSPTRNLYEQFSCCVDAGWISVGMTNNPFWTGDVTRVKTIELFSQICDGVRLNQGQANAIAAGFTNLETITQFPISGDNASVYLHSCDGCQIPSARCSISIKSSGGITIYQGSGVCPITYETNCDDDCHDGCCKIITQSYPGYCCAKSP